MSAKKMMPSLAVEGESEYDRFVTFAKTILAVPRSKAMPERELSKLEAEKRKVAGKITKMRRKLARRKSTTPSSCESDPKATDTTSAL